jgi:leucyl/phenylalanyl-tRNA--protein transferase
MYWIIDVLFISRIGFPDVALTHSSGIIALGGDLSPTAYISAYKSGIFSWFEDGEPILGGHQIPEWFYR